MCSSSWRLHRLGRNLRHLIILLEELQAHGIAFVSLGEGIDATTPAGKLPMHILGAIAEVERARIAERVRAGLQRARAQGKQLGRPKEGAVDDRGSRRVCARRGAHLGRVQINGSEADQRWSAIGRCAYGALVNANRCMVKRGFRIDP
jgi:DNA invertase Pin-like site-specific DNA recombinase